MAKTMLDFGTRVQYSVFECIISDEKLLEKMISKLGGMGDEGDSVRVYALCAKCERTITVLGGGSVTKDENVYIV